MFGQPKHTPVEHYFGQRLTEEQVGVLDLIADLGARSAVQPLFIGGAGRRTLCEWAWNLGRGEAKWLIEHSSA